MSLDVLARHTQRHTHIGSCQWDRGTKVRSAEGAEKVGDVGNLVCRRRVVVSSEKKEYGAAGGLGGWVALVVAVGGWRLAGWREWD